MSLKFELSPNGVAEIVPSFSDCVWLNVDHVKKKPT